MQCHCRVRQGSTITLYDNTAIALARIFDSSERKLLFEVFSQRHERGSTLVASSLPFGELTEAFSRQRLTGAMLDRLTTTSTLLAAIATNTDVV